MDKKKDNLPKPVKVKKSNEQLEKALKQTAVYFYRFFWVFIFMAVVIEFAVVYMLFIKPKYDSIQSKQEIVAAQQEYAEKMGQYGDLIDLRKAYAELDVADIEKINQIVDSSSDQSVLFSEIDFLAEEKGLKLTSMETLPLDESFELNNIANNKKRTPLIAQVKVAKTTAQFSSVSYIELKDVLAQMEVNLRIMDVVDLKYDPNTKTATIEFLTYYF